MKKQRDEKYLSKVRRHEERVRWSNIWSLRRKQLYEGEGTLEEIMAKYFSGPMKSTSPHIQESNPLPSSK